MARIFGKRIVLLVAAGWLALAVFCAGAYVVEQQDHDHTGGDCAVCLRMEIALGLLEAAWRAGAVFAAVMFALPPWCGRGRARAAAYRPAFLPSPVSLKTRSNT